MRIDDKTWQAIVATARAEIERMNGLLKEHGAQDPFTAEMRSTDDHELLITARAWERRAVARHISTGELRKASVDRKGRCKITPPPKSWTKLAGKPAADMVKGLRLTDYLLVLDSKITGVSTFSTGAAGVTSVRKELSHDPRH